MTFQEHFFARMFQKCYELDPGPRTHNEIQPNPWLLTWRDYLRRPVRLWLNRYGYAQRFFDIPSAARQASEIMGASQEFERVYSQLSDHPSRETLIDVLITRCLGTIHCPAVTPAEDFWKEYYAVDSVYLKKPATRNYWGWKLGQYECPGRDGLIRFHATPGHVLCQFLLQQYRLNAADRVIEAEPGDVVIDAGACFGETALYFADRVGQDGAVYSFEFVPESLKLFEEHLHMNPHLQPRIHIVENALSDISNETIFFEEDGPATKVLKNSDRGSEATTLSIDDFVPRLKGRPISFIKMDIEGAEPDALRGAERTLRRDRPKLAIAIYHKWTHLYEIQDYLNQLDLGYRFYIRHFTPIHSETVLFAQSE